MMFIVCGVYLHICLDWVTVSYMPLHSHTRDHSYTHQTHIYIYSQTIYPTPPHPIIHSQYIHTVYTPHSYTHLNYTIYIQDKASITEDTHLTGLNEILGDETQSLAIIKAAKSSMGMDTSESDMNNIIIFTERMISLALYRKQLYSYLEDKMAIVAPNLSTLIGRYRCVYSAYSSVCSICVLVYINMLYEYMFTEVHITRIINDILYHTRI